MARGAFLPPLDATLRLDAPVPERATQAGQALQQLGAVFFRIGLAHLRQRPGVGLFAFFGADAEELRDLREGAARRAQLEDAALMLGFVGGRYVSAA